MNRKHRQKGFRDQAHFSWLVHLIRTNQYWTLIGSILSERNTQLFESLPVSNPNCHMADLRAGQHRFCAVLIPKTALTETRLRTALKMPAKGTFNECPIIVLPTDAPAAADMSKPLTAIQAEPDPT
jgi:hypothetical protein